MRHSSRVTSVYVDPVTRTFADTRRLAFPEHLHKTSTAPDVLFLTPTGWGSLRISLVLVITAQHSSHLLNNSIRLDSFTTHFLSSHISSSLSSCVVVAEVDVDLVSFLVWRTIQRKQADVQTIFSRLWLSLCCSSFMTQTGERNDAFISNKRCVK